MRTIITAEALTSTCRRTRRRGIRNIYGNDENAAFSVDTHAVSQPATRRVRDSCATSSHRGKTSSISLTTTTPL